MRELRGRVYVQLKRDRVQPDSPHMQRRAGRDVRRRRGLLPSSRLSLGQNAVRSIDRLGDDLHGLVLYQLRLQQRVLRVFDGRHLRLLRAAVL